MVVRAVALPARATAPPLALALALAAVLAGCSEPAPVPAGIPVGEHGEALPTVHGVVVDEAIRPLAGVRVRLLGSGLEATTDEDGAYEIRRPTLQAEHVLLSAAKAGFITRAQQVQVSGHVSAKLDFRLDADPSVLPHVDVLKRTASLPCAGRLASALGTAGVLCPAEVAPMPAMAPPPPWSWLLDTDPGIAGAVVELDWEPATPLAERLHARLVAPVAGGQGGETVDEAEGGSPLRLEVPEDVARAMPRWTTILLEVDLDLSSAAPAGASAEQSFDAFATLFYVDAAPPGYRLS